MPEQMRIHHITKPIAGKDHPHSKKHPDTHPLLKVQQAVGNQACLRLRGSLGTMQTKLSVGKSHDIYEQEADAVASRVVKQLARTDNVSLEGQGSSQQVQTVQREEMPEDEMQLHPADNIQREEMPEDEMQLRPVENIQRQEDDELVELRPSEDIQRQAEEEDEEEEEEEYVMPRRTVNRSGSLVEGPVSEDLENQVQRARQGGEAMDTSLRGQMENGFGYDFQQVHIHNDAKADNLSRQLKAEAFTIKGDIFFRNGRYNPTSAQGQDLIAHELTHVVQQGAAANQTANETVAPVG